MPDGAVRLAAAFDGPPGAPVLVLGSSLGTTGDLWRAQLPVLAGRYRVLRYEHRGHGGSPAPPGPYRIDDLAGDVLRLLDAEGVRRAHYAGISLGGMVGMAIAASAPERIGSLVLCCTSAFMPPAGDWYDRAARVRSSGLGPVAELVQQSWFPPGFPRRDPTTVARFEAMVAAQDPEGYAGCCEAIAAMDLRQALGKITAPALVVSGTADIRTPPAHGAVIAAGIPGARLRVVRGAAHLANVTHAAEVTALLLDHLAAGNAQADNT